MQTNKLAVFRLATVTKADNWSLDQSDTEPRVSAQSVNVESAKALISAVVNTDNPDTPIDCSSVQVYTAENSDEAHINRWY